MSWYDQCEAIDEEIRKLIKLLINLKSFDFMVSRSSTQFDICLVYVFTENQETKGRCGIHYPTWIDWNATQRAECIKERVGGMIR